MPTICNRGAIIAIVVNLWIFAFTSYAFEGITSLQLLSFAILNLVLEMVLSPRILTLPISALAAIVFALSLTGNWFEVGLGATIFIAWFLEKKYKAKKVLEKRLITTEEAAETIP